MEFKKAERKQLKLRIALIGASGSGKTYSALRLASGISDKIAVIDTENRRSEIYATEFNFDVLNLDPPFTPEMYIEAIKSAESAGYEVLIIDSMSHEWIGNGGLLQTKSQMTDKNDFTKWAKLTPRHDAFIDKIVRADLHVICTLRGKDEYVLEVGETGKQTPKKVGVGSQQRDGFEYECTAAFLIDQEKHIANVTKDNTHLFENKYEHLTEEHGEQLKKWASEGISIEPVISKDQLKRLFTIANGNADLAKEVIEKYGFKSSKDVTKITYEVICEEIELKVKELAEKVVRAS